MLVDDNNIVIICHRCRTWTKLTLGALTVDGRHETTCECGTLGVVTGTVSEVTGQPENRQPVRYTRPRP